MESGEWRVESGSESDIDFDPQHAAQIHKRLRAYTNIWESEGGANRQTPYATLQRVGRVVMSRRA